MDQRHTKVVRSDEQPDGGAIPLGRGYYLIYSDSAASPVLGTKSLSTTYGIDFPPGAALDPALREAAGKTEAATDLIPILYHFFDAPTVRQELASKNATLHWAAPLPDAGPALSLATGRAVLRASVLLSFSDIDGIIWIEPVATQPPKGGSQL